MESREELLLAFLEGELDGEARERLLAELGRDPGLAEEVRRAAAGLGVVRDLRELEKELGDEPRESAAAKTGVSAWWVAASVAAALVIAVPATWWAAGVATPDAPRAAAGAPTSGNAAPTLGRPVDPAPSFVLVLEGRWPDLDVVEPAEARRRAAEYWEWTSALADRGVLLAAGDLGWQPGERLASGGAPVAIPADAAISPDFVIGMFALRVGSYEEALDVARECPHLRYGGSVSVRAVGTGFVTTGGFGDW